MQTNAVGVFIEKCGIWPIFYKQSVLYATLSFIRHYLSCANCSQSAKESANYMKHYEFFKLMR